MLPQIIIFVLEHDAHNQIITVEHTEREFD
jgi:hypothetical protein